VFPCMCFSVCFSVYVFPVRFDLGDYLLCNWRGNDDPSKTILHKLFSVYSVVNMVAVIR